MNDLAFLSAVELGALLRERQLSPVELLESTLRRIDATEPEIGAFVDIDHERALEQARAIAADDRRVFAGVPTAVKANVPVAGLVSDHGSALLSSHRFDYDAYVVRRLREAGFVIVGTTKLPEMGILPTTEPRNRGPARNPWNTAHTPGGSSGGSAAAVASGMLPIAHGNDGGGSIRIPAACCGLLGLKPSRGRVSRGPDLGDHFLTVDGVLSRSVLDTAAALDVLAGYEVGDATWAPPPGEPYSAGVRRPAGRLRVAVVTVNPLGHDLDPANERAVREAGELLASLGHSVSEQEPQLPGPETLDTFLTVYAANIGLGAAYAQLLAGREAGPDDLEPLTLAMAERAQRTTSVELLGAMAMLHAIARRVVALWANFDLMLVPALAGRPPALGTIDSCSATPMEDFDRAVAFAPYAGLFNVTGQPGIAVPWDVGADGLPTAVQIIGPPLAEDTLLQVAGQIEHARPWAQRRPPQAVTAG